ncbi:PfaD family polyunsaturated fatty acid/polyketide biosynthesis protein [Streptomyces sp. NPDC020845]|uniref:PfaD family polyunsaturated fatty acid/polyketide biosynthesis protein n=1 Tax=Streptomyces sp. NPDC020845 TaxID=3365096 RepID=UPI00379ED6A7
MTVRYDPDGVYAVLADLDAPCYIVRNGDRIGATSEPHVPGSPLTPLAVAGPMPSTQLGDSGFRRRHGVSHAYLAGSMAAGIASEELVAALARAGFLASFGAAGLSPERVERALTRLAHESGAPGGLPYAANLIHTPHAPRLERAVVDLFLSHRLRCVEASAFVQLTPDLVRYRVAGLRPGPGGGAYAENRLIAKVSRAEVAELFLRPAPEPMVRALFDRGEITAEQVTLARLVPMVDDLTVEADSAGHTDRRPLITALPAMLRLRDRIARELGHAVPPVRVGAAGGIGTPEAALAAFSLGAAYVVTGSVNQACLEAGTSPAVKALLAAAGPADYAMAPAADMFEVGAEVQVLRSGSLFAGRARRLHELYRAHAGLDELPAADRRRLEAKVFQRPLSEVWRETADYLTEHHPEQLLRAELDARHRMALVFRWYLGQSSRWAVTGAERTGDYQVWCGPAMGAFNDWAAGSVLADPGRRHVADVARHLMHGAAFHRRLAHLRFSGVRIPAACATYRLPSAPSAVPATP